MAYTFVCHICKKSIDVGLEPMTVDDSNNSFHKSCVESFPSPQTTPAPPPPPRPPPPPFATYPFVCRRCGAGISATAPRSCSRCYLDLCGACEAEGCCGDRPARIGEKTYCSACGKPCRSMCPACGKYIHSSYGMFNQNCGGQHEETCPGARELRSVSKPAPVLVPAGMKEPIYDTISPKAKKARAAKKKPRPAKRGRTAKKRRERARR